MVVNTSGQGDTTTTAAVVRFSGEYGDPLAADDAANRPTPTKTSTFPTYRQHSTTLGGQFEEGQRARSGSHWLRARLPMMLPQLSRLTSGGAETSALAQNLPLLSPHMSSFVIKLEELDLEKTPFAQGGGGAIYRGYYNGVRIAAKTM